MTHIARRFFPWVVVDLPLVWFSYALALLVRGVTTDLEYAPALLFAALGSVVVVACNEAFGIYRRWWRFATSQDLVPLTVSMGSATVALIGLNLAWPGFRPMPMSVVFLGGFFALCAMTAARYRSKPLAAIRRTWRRLTAPPAAGVTRVLIVGAGESGQHLGWQLQNNAALSERHQVIGFVDDDVRKHGRLIHGRQVFGGRDVIPGVVERESIDLIVLAIHTIAGRELRDIVAICQETPAQIKSLPSALAPIEGGLVRPASVGPLGDSLFGDLTFEDLLGRHSVNIDREQCRHLVRGKTVLVTGASGSIGSELCRQLADLRPARLVMLDTNESGVHDLSVELQGFRSDDTTLVPVVGDVTHERRLRALFAGERPALVFHAAAYKHVPLMEEYPEEAVRVNVGGTRLMMQLAGEYGAERFVLVSSDKAVEPSSVMGATKRVCELLATSRRDRRTLYTAVRFGNVLASRGSVVPTFAKQIDMGGPVTITDLDMSRYFMSISEAASLVVQAANFTTGNDVFLLDMGEEINIADLARRMIRLRGLRPDVDIPIVVTGPRPGEKLREVLHSSDEHTQPTPHPQVVRVLGMRWPLSHAELEATADELLGAAADGDRSEVRSLLWLLARDGAAPPRLVARPSTSGGTGLLGSAAALGWTRGPGSGTMALAPAGVGGPTGGAVALPDPRAPIRVLADRVGEALRRTADRALALEPWYVVPLAALILTSPAGTIWPAALVAVPWLIRLARTGELLATTWFSVPIALLAGGGVLGMLVTSSPLQGSIRLNGLVAAIALYWLIVHHATTLPRLRRALQLAIVGSAAGSLLLLFIVAPYLPWGVAGGPLDGLVAATDPLRQLVLSSSEALQRYRFRASGVGALATFGLALALGPALAAARRQTRLACFGLVLAFLTVIILSGSRSSLVSVLALMVVLVGLRYGWLLLAVPFVLVGLWAVAERGLGGLGAPDAVPLSVKISFWQNAAAILHDFPITGVGLGQRAVRDVYEAYMLAIGPTFSHAHNAFIQAYLEQGLLGLFGLVSLTLVLLFNARRTVANARSPLSWSVALSAAGAAIVELFEGLTEVVLLTSVGTVLLLVALGLLTAAGRLDARARRARKVTGLAPERRSTRLVRPLVAAPLAAGLVAIGLVTFTLTPLASPLFLNLGAVERTRAVLTDDLPRVEREQGLARADRFLRRALAADDGDAAIWRNLAEVSLARGDVGRAREYLAEARTRTSFGDWYSLYQLGRVSRDAGLWREAAFAWREARAESALQVWAQEAKGRDQWDRAAIALAALAELRPTEQEPFQQLTQMARQSRGAREAAIRELERLAEVESHTPWPLVELATLAEEQGDAARAAELRQQADLRRQ